MVKGSVRKIWLCVSFVCLLMGIGWSGWWYQNRSVPLHIEQALGSVQLRAVSPIPMKIASASAETTVLASISAQSVFVMDGLSRATLLEKNAQAPLYPASTTKLMTALVVMQNYDLDEILTASSSVLAEGSVLGIQSGQSFSVRDLLAALLITSSNDASMMLASAHRQGLLGFVGEMNRRAQQLSLTSTKYLNPSGLDATGQQSTAQELAWIAQEVMKDPVLRDLVHQTSKTIFDSTGKQTYHLVNTNALLSVDPDFIGIKTGTTELAKEMLISQYVHGGHEVLVVVAGSEDRYADTLKIKEWIENSYTWIPANSATLE